MQDNVPASGILTAFAAARIVPILRSPSRGALAAEVERLHAAGVDLIEATTSTPGWPGAVAELAGRHADLNVGVGSVTTPAQAEQAVGAGAAFLVSPYGVAAVRAWAAEAGVPLIEGALTPGEIAAALQTHGVAKVFPASLGGPDYIRSLLTVLPGAKLIPTGGIGLKDVPSYLSAGALAVGVGSNLANDPDPAGALVQLREQLA